MSLQIKHIFLHPVKSMMGQSVKEVAVSANGFEGDRQFVVISDRGKFRTARECPSLLLVKALYADGHLTLSAGGGLCVSVPLSATALELQTVKVWDDEVTGADMGDEVAHWLSNYLGKASRLLSIVDASVRQGKYRGTPKSFADAGPLLLTSDASLVDLNARLESPVRHQNFRPNIVIAGKMEPFEEDLWEEIKIGDIHMQVAWGCNRCVLTTVDPDSGKKSSQMEPIATLKTFRKAADKNIYFGQNIIPRQAGIISVGDEVQIIARREQPLYAAEGLK